MTLKITYPVDALVSYHYYREDRDMLSLVRTGRLRMIGDSGAFSALTKGTPIDLAEYAAWCLRWRDHLCWTASLDVIGDPGASHRNWVTLRDRYDLAVVPTVHAGAATKWIDTYAAEGVDLIGLGGMAGLGQAVRAFRWAVHMFRHARDRWPNLRFHLWGVTARKYLDNLPAWSADSSGILGSTYRYGSLRLFDPGTGHHKTVMLRGTQVYQVAPLLRRVYGVNPDEIAKSHAGNRTLLARLGAASVQQYAGWLQARHGHIAAPTYGQTVPPAAPVGPHLHAIGSTNSIDDLAAVVAEDPPGPPGPPGPRVHLLGSNRGGRERVDELAALVTDPAGPAGPHIHMVDTSQDKVGRGLAFRDIATDSPPSGPRLHCAETYAGDLVATTITTEESSR